ncbi:TonB family protein [Candidatus Poribacteria bacterium]|nr:TonB family protein [Candidatus Poribacteria bacterium]MYB66410.1 TonB family protein [Candidatus Poribacteria bacterium]MYF54762.1 TonB family protein [Candidatus Poribacteria bacterium]
MKTTITLTTLIYFLLLSSTVLNSDQTPGQLPPNQKSEVTPPRIKNLVKPVYPQQAKRLEKEGTVKLQASIDINGIPKNIVALTTLGFGLEAAAIEALKQSTFHPAIKNGKPIKVTVQIPFDFKLDSSDSKMVYINAGEFQMGSEIGNTDEKPIHTVYLDAFYIDKHEVTNAEYKQFVDANPKWGKEQIPREYHDGYYLAHWNGNDYPIGKDNHPVVYVSWYAAMAYAQWTEKRLPTEAEWEKAARGGLLGKIYPWGDEIDPTKANYYDATNKELTPVGTYPENGYGLYDMAGNVREWCLDSYIAYYYENSPKQNPVAGSINIQEAVKDFIKMKSDRALRGGSWLNSKHSSRVTNRSKRAPTDTNPNEGFRCVKR